MARELKPRCTIGGCSYYQEVRTWCTKHAEKKADDAFSLWVRARDGMCTAVGVLDGPCNGNLQAAHGVGRGNHTTRFDPRNVHALCGHHHRIVDSFGKEGLKHAWLVARLGEEGYAQLMVDSRVITKRRLAVAAAVEEYL